MKKNAKRQHLLRIAIMFLTLVIFLNACQSDSKSSSVSNNESETVSRQGDKSEAGKTSGDENESSEEVEPLHEIVKDGKSDFVILYDGDGSKVAAYTLREIIQRETGAVLSVELEASDSEREKAIYLLSADKGEVGNYGYAIDANESSVKIHAATLSGFDMAIKRIASDCLSEKTMNVDIEYGITENLEWASDYVIEAEDFNEEYTAGTFYNDKNDSVAYVSNAMWHMFGLVDDGQELVYRFGNEPTWYEWLSEKIMWSGDTDYISTLKGLLRNYPQVSTGYMWSWGGSPYWEVDGCYSIHYDGTFRYIAAVYDFITWEGKTDFLFEVDTNTSPYSYAHMDYSKGRTVLEKAEACMYYILEYLHGKDGYILLTEESTYLNADGSERFDYVIKSGEYCWDNTGKDGSTASNYWDNLCFGNYDGYENALFYNALNSMAGIYRMLGGEYVSKAEELETLAVTVKEKFNELYWSDETGRYIACIDTDGRKVDFGLTFHNFEILKYGLADDEKAKSIFDWVDGDRIVKGEKRSGDDIFSYAKIMEKVDSAEAKKIRALNLRLAAVTNTVPINNFENKNLGVAWWHGPAGIDVWGSASYGMHLENGGYIFYPVFYELMARTVYEGAQSTTKRLAEIAKVYEYNRLVSDAAAAGSTFWLEGLNGEFPESGLVPTSYLYSLIGVSAEYDGLHISPAFNDVYEYMGVKEIKYGGKKYAVQVNRDGSCEITATEGVIDMTLHYTPERFSKLNYTVSITNSDGSVTTSTVTPDANGVVRVELKNNNISNVCIAPVLE